MNLVVREAFSRAAPRYDAHATQQKEVMRRLAQMLEPYKQSDAVVFDIGAGTGQLPDLTDWEVVACDAAEGMCRIASARQPVFVADMHELPLPNVSCETLFSSLALQWSDDLPRAFSEWQRVLKAEGMIALSCYLFNTLNELDLSFKVMDKEKHLRPFPEMTQFLDMIKSAGLTPLETKTETLILEHNRLIDLISYLRIIGANRASSSVKGMKTRRYYERLEAAYPVQDDGKLRSSWQVGYVIARKGL